VLGQDILAQKASSATATATATILFLCSSFLIDETLLFL